MPLDLADLGLSDDSNHPVKTALARACVGHFNEASHCGNRAATLLNAANAPGGTQDEATRAAIKTELDSALQHISAWNQLLDWICPARLPMAFKEALGWAQQMRDWGIRADLVEELAKGLQKRNVGRPHQHDRFVEAFELLLCPKQTLGKATRQLCRCGAEQHNRACEMRMKAGIQNLKKILRAHAPDLVDRYDTLHPDRAAARHG
jgi:hypothetical protein